VLQTKVTDLQHFRVVLQFHLSFSKLEISLQKEYLDRCLFTASNCCSNTRLIGLLSATKDNKHLMTVPKGNSEFCFPEALNVSRGEAAWPVIKCFVYFPTQKYKKNCEEIVCLTPAGSQICSGFKEYDLVTCESKVQVVVSLGS